MARGRRPVRGGRTKSDRHQSKRPKTAIKKGKFNFREATYVKDRDAKNEEIENRRKRLELEEERKRKYEDEESEEDEQLEDPMATLMSSITCKNASKKTAIDSETESDSDEEIIEENEKIINKMKQEQTVEIDNSSNETDTEQDDEFTDTIEIPTKEEDMEDEETAREDAGILHDPFAIHLINDLSNDLHKVISSASPTVETHRLTWPTLGSLTVQIPKPDCSETPQKKPKLICDTRQYAEAGKVPVIINDINWNKLYIKSQIQNNISRANYSNIADNLDNDKRALTPIQRELFSIMNNYQDLLFFERTNVNEDQIRFSYCLHAINHLLKTRTKILHHNAKISKSHKTSTADIPDEYRDQGLVRPKILIIVPFRHSCLKIVELLIAILIGEEKGGTVMNKIRFMEDFGGNEIRMPKKNPKPEDYEKTFSGNTDDSFKIGISVTKKTLKLYSEFYSSDIIISSVLGLKMLVGAENEDERDYDFLASIELLIIDQTELLFMQNWDHLIHVLNHLHLQPKNTHDTDFSRVRSWSVNGWSKYYRQTLIFSSIQLPEIHAIFNKHCQNYAGKIKIINPITNDYIAKIAVQLPQVFHKFNANSHKQAIDGRLEFFTTKILPQYKDSIMNHTAIFVPSYFDYVKLRNYFKKEELNFVQICEYSKDAKVARARDMFYHSDAHFLIYSERYHFFNRIRLKGIRHLIFYAPPSFPHFYSEMCNLMEASNQNPRSGSDSNMTVTMLYSKYDIMQLAAFIGTERANKMIASDKNMHMLMSGE